MFSAQRAAIAVIAAAVTVHTLPAHGGTLTTLHQFTGAPDGNSPSGFTGANGSLFGTSLYGGTKKENAGTIFKIDPRTGTERIIQSFGFASGGAIPNGTLAVKGDHIYGTTLGGGSAQVGILYKVDISTGHKSVLYSFSNSGDGAFPEGVMYRSGALYGTTETGGPNQGGVVFKYDEDSRAETTLYGFGQYYTPNDALIYHQGLLYGTGCSNACTVFSVDATTGDETTLHTFGYVRRGDQPEAGVILQGRMLFGTTTFGGDGYPGYGTVYRVDKTTGGFRILHHFHDKADGAYSTASLTYRNDFLFGTTQGGGTGYGTLFKVQSKTGKATALYAFTGGGDGGYPSSQLIYQDGSFYGTTLGGGSNCGCGTVFKFTP